MILVFGGGGQFAREFVRLARERALPITALSRDEADIADGASVSAALARVRPGIVVNGAAYTQVDRAETEAAAAFAANATGPGVLAAACAGAGLPLVHLSTDYVFDGTKPGAYREDDPVAPLGVYGRSKEAGEGAVREACSRHVILRTSWVYGAHGANFVKTMLRLAAERDELRVVADQRGCPTSTADLAEAVLAVIRSIERGESSYGTFHFAGTGATTWHGLAERVVRAQSRHTGRRPAVIPIATQEYPTLARRPANSELDSSLFRETFGLSARPWPEAVDLVVDAIFADMREHAGVRARQESR